MSDMIEHIMSLLTPNPWEARLDTLLSSPDTPQSPYRPLLTPIW